MTTKLRIGDATHISMIGDGKTSRHFGNCLGIVMIPPQGGWQWHAINGDWGDVASEAEAIKTMDELTEYLRQPPTLVFLISLHRHLLAEAWREVR